MKRVFILIFVMLFLFSCAKKDDSRIPKGAFDTTFSSMDEETYRPLPGDENIKNSEVAYNLSLEYAQARNMPAAHHYIDLAMRIEPHAKYSYTKGVYYLNEKRYELALKWLNRAFSEGPHELQAKLDILNAQGVVLKELKRYEEAKNKFREIINTEGLISRFNAYYNLGLIYLEEGNYDDAENVFRKAIEENPNDYRCYVKMGRIALNKKDYISAYADYQKASEIVEYSYNALQTDGPEIFYYLGESLFYLKRYEEARKALMRVIKISPEGPFGRKAKELLAKIPEE